MTLTFILRLIATLACSDQLIGQLNAMPHGSPSYFRFNETTTAVPPHYVSQTDLVAHTPTMSITKAKMTPTPSPLYTTKIMLGTQSGVSSRLSSIPSSTIGTISPRNPEVKKNYSLLTTTAIPVSLGPLSTDHQFDRLSFAGGALAAIGLIGIGTFAWKMYATSIERSYWTF